MAIGRSVEAGPQRVGQGVDGQLGQGQWARRNAEAVQPGRPEGLVDQDGHWDRRYARAQPGPGGASSGVMDHGGRPGKQPLVRQVVDQQDVVTDGSELGPAGLDDGAHADPVDRGRDDVVESLVGRGHAAEPDEYRRGTGPEEVDQLVRRPPVRRHGRPPVSGHMRRSGPVGGSGDHGRAEAVADRPVIRWGRRLRGGGEVEPGAQPPQHVGVEGTGSGEHLAARGDVVSGRELPGIGPAWWRELPGGNPWREVDAEARDAEASGDEPAQRGRAECGEQDVGAGGHRGRHALAQLVEERGEDRSRGLRGRGGRARAYELERIAGQGTIFQPALAHEIGEPVVGGEGHLMARPPQLLAQARERRDVTSRSRGHDQNPHHVSPVVPLCFPTAALPATAYLSPPGAPQRRVHSGSM